MQLAHDAASGEDVPFELVDESGNDGPPLWCHRTLTGEFIRRRIGVIGMLPSYRPAAEALERVEGLDEWLLAHGEQHVPASARDRSDATLRVFLAEVLGETASFHFEEDRFETTWSALDALLFEGRTAVLLAAPLHGVEIESDELRLVDDTLLVSNRSIEAEALPGDLFRGDGLPVTVALVEADDPSPEALGHARQKLRRLLCALRLFGESSPALGGAARMQVARGPWQVLGLEGSGSARGVLAIEAEREGELTEFCSLVSRRWPRGGEIAWALRRHEFGCDRLHYSDSLSDHLLALRALLEPEGPTSGQLTQRVAALCALPEDRARLAERTARAVALERSSVTGISAHEPEAEALSLEIEGHLRALVRDVICGHLDSDLRGLADSIIAESAAPAEAETPTGRDRSSGRRRFGEPDSLAA
jgi:hypothetical protein